MERVVTIDTYGGISLPMPENFDGRTARVTALIERRAIARVRAAESERQLAIESSQVESLHHALETLSYAFQDFTARKGKIVQVMSSPDSEVAARLTGLHRAEESARAARETAEDIINDYDGGIVWSQLHSAREEASGAELALQKSRRALNESSSKALDEEDRFAPLRAYGQFLSEQVNALQRKLDDARARLKVRQSENSSLNESIVGLDKEIEALQRETLKDIYMDALTSVANRRAFDQEVGEAFVTGAIMIFDVDHFKQVNDNHGHHSGDALLETLGRVLIEFTAREAKAFRVGGDEFAVYFAQLDPADAEGRFEALRRLWFRARGSETPTLSVGFAFSQAVPIKGRALLKRADGALYEAKRKGRNTYSVVS